MEKLKKLWSTVRDFYNTRLITNLISQNKDDYNSNAQRNFDAAKKLSDFVGMIVRYAFAQGATTYFFKKLETATGAGRYALWLCAIFAFFLTLVLGIRILWIIVLYEAEDIHATENVWGRRLFFLCALIQGFALWYGVRMLVNDIAASGVLG